MLDRLPLYSFNEILASVYHLYCCHDYWFYCSIPLDTQTLSSSHVFIMAPFPLTALRRPVAICITYTYEVLNFFAASMYTEGSLASLILWAIVLSLIPAYICIVDECKTTIDFAIMQEDEQKKSPIKQRILQFVETLGISKRDFYGQVGISRGTLESGSGITEDVMAKFIAKYPNINVEWLVSGHGAMFKDQQMDVPAIRTDTQQGIPLIPISAMAGFGEGDMAVLEYECERFIIPTFKDAEFLIQVKGDSMYPKYSSGDIVACKKLSLDTFFQWNKVYVLDTEQGALIKRVKNSGKEDTLLIVSDNPSYEPFELHRKHIRSVALVVGVVRIE